MSQTKPIAPVFRLPLLDKAACAALFERLLDVEAFWIARHPTLPFHTLGATNYYDITANPLRPYDGLTAQYNPLLRSLFDDLYVALSALLAGHLGAAVHYHEGSALPGFHIFGGDPAFAPDPSHDVTHADWFQRRDGGRFPGNPIHVDTAHRALGLQGPTLSVTLPVRLPDTGAGLRLWPLQESDARGLLPHGLRELFRRTPFTDETYSEGEVIVHDGNWFHQARGLPRRAGDYRVTLQGHGVRMDDGWHLFW